MIIVLNGLYIDKGLSKVNYQRIVELAKRCEEHDGFSDAFTMNYPVLESRVEDEINDVLYFHDGQLVGYCGMFSFINKHEVEMSGVVHPNFRRKGIFTEIIQVAVKECDQREVQRVLLVVNRESKSGKGYVDKIDAQYHLSEYKMDFRQGFSFKEKGKHRGIIIAPAEKIHIPQLLRIGALSFEKDEEMFEGLIDRNMNHPRYKTYVVSYQSEHIGMITVSEEGEISYISAFCILPSYQGKGYGRQILSETVQNLVNEGKRAISLDVEINNLGALKLYESCGFAVESGYDFYLLKS